MEENIPEQEEIQVNTPRMDIDDKRNSSSTLKIHDIPGISRDQLETSSGGQNAGSGSLRLPQPTNKEPHSLASSSKIIQESASNTIVPSLEFIETESFTHKVRRENVRKSQRSKKAKRLSGDKQTKSASGKCKRKTHIPSRVIQHLQKDRHHRQSRKHLNIRFGMRRNYRLLKQESNEKTVDLAFSDSRVIHSKRNDCGPSCSSQHSENNSEGSPCNTDLRCDNNSTCPPCCIDETNSNYNECPSDPLSPCPAECCGNSNFSCPLECPGDCSTDSCAECLCDCNSPCTPDCQMSCSCSSDCSCYNESPSMEEEI